MEQITCRTCLVCIPDKNKSIKISRSYGLEKTVRDVIVKLVPEMVSTLFEEDCVCSKCFRTLKSSYKFIVRCLEVELLNAEKREALQQQNDVEDFLENGVKCTEAKEDVLVNEQIDFDHNYYSNIDGNDRDPLYIENKAVDVNNALENYSTPIEMVFESLIFKEQELNIKDEDSNLSECVLLESLSLYNEVKDENNCNLDSGCVSQEITVCSNDFNFEKSQPTNSNLLETDKFTCPTCLEEFTCYSDYDLHLDTHLRHRCSKGIKSRDGLRAHIRQHTRQSIRICEICGKTFNNTDRLKVHISSVHITERAYMCDRCSKTFKTILRLRYHIKSVHDKIAQQKCQECGKIFGKKETYKKHYRLVHLKLKQFVCKICGKEFGRGDYLRNHMVSHTGEQRPKVQKYASNAGKKYAGKPVDCKLCGETISNRENLKLHLKIHKKMRRYKCKYCDLPFTRSENRNRHQLLHEKDPEYKLWCAICYKRMKTKEELEQHVAGHYKARPPKHSCNICGEKFHRKNLLEYHKWNNHLEDIKEAEEETVYRCSQDVDLKS